MTPVTICDVTGHFSLHEPLLSGVDVVIIIITEVDVLVKLFSM